MRPRTANAVPSAERTRNQATRCETSRLRTHITSVNRPHSSWTGPSSRAVRLRPWMWTFTPPAERVREPQREEGVHHAVVEPSIGEVARLHRRRGDGAVPRDDELDRHLALGFAIPLQEGLVAGPDRRHVVLDARVDERFGDRAE